MSNHAYVPLFYTNGSNLLSSFNHISLRSFHTGAYSVPLFLASGEFLNDSLFLITLSYVVLLSPLPSLVPSPLLTGLTPPSDLTPNSCTRLFISLVSSGLDYTSGVSHPSSVQGIFLKRNFGACI